jgi:parvulin-like peptidyl-prolyl isomerase
MKLIRMMAILLLFGFSFHTMPAFAAESASAPTLDQDTSVGAEQDTVTLKAPLFSPLFSSTPIASVNDEVITLEDVKESIGAMHADMKEGKAKSRRDYAALLKRLINVRLILQEAKNIGLDELPETEQAVNAYEQRILIELVQKERVKDVKPDEKAAENIYRELVKEIKVASALFVKESDAREAESKIRAGAKFDEVIDRAVVDGTATGEKEGAYFKNKDMLPQVARAAAELTVGSVSSVIPVSSGFTLFKLEDIRYPENPEAREQARMQVLYTQRITALTQYNHGLSKKYVKLNKAVYDSINYDTGKLAALMKDKRAVAEIKGGKPITVRELTETLENKLYHGAERGRGGKKMNEKKREVLEEIFARRLLKQEALRQGIDRTALFKRKMKEYRNSLIFNTFVQKAIVPDIKLSTEELKKYYDSHTKEFSFPEMMRIKTLAFVKKELAERAREKLLKGTDFQWLSDNAEGRLDRSMKDPLNIGNEVVVVSDLPEDIQKALEGARSEDARLYHPQGGFYYVLYIAEKIPSKPQPFEEVKESIANKLFNEKLNKAVEDWAQKLRNASDVKVYATGFNN